MQKNCTKQDLEEH